MTDYSDIKRRLREQAIEIARAGHAGWGNASSDAADAIEALEKERDEAARTFPLQCDRHGTGPTRIPWSVAEEAYGAYARRYGREQSLERISQRGGFG